jgi:hypothetical protein
LSEILSRVEGQRGFERRAKRDQKSLGEVSKMTGICPKKGAAVYAGYFSAISLRMLGMWSFS